MQFEETVDVVVVGSGLASGIAAITVADAGVKILLIEKSKVPGERAGAHACPGAVNATT